MRDVIEGGFVGVAHGGQPSPTTLRVAWASQIKAFMVGSELRKLKACQPGRASSRPVRRALRRSKAGVGSHGGKRRAAAAPELVERLSCDLAVQIPERDFDARRSPVAGGRDVIEALRVKVDIEGISHQQGFPRRGTGSMLPGPITVTPWSCRYLECQAPPSLIEGQGLPRPSGIGAEVL